MLISSTILDMNSFLFSRSKTRNFSNLGSKIRYFQLKNGFTIVNLVILTCNQNRTPKIAFGGESQLSSKYGFSIQLNMTLGRLTLHHVFSCKLNDAIEHCVVETEGFIFTKPRVAQNFLRCSAIFWVKSQQILDAPF